MELLPPLPMQPNWKPPQARKPVKRRSKSRQAKEQPRDSIGRFARIGLKIKAVKRKARKIKNNLSPSWHLKRVQKTRRQNQRQELYQQHQLLAPTKLKRRKRSTVARPSSIKRR